MLSYFINEKQTKNWKNSQVEKGNGRVLHLRKSFINALFENAQRDLKETKRAGKMLLKRWYF
jgi:hypothetical protein